MSHQSIVFFLFFFWGSFQSRNFASVSAISGSDCFLRLRSQEAEKWSRAAVSICLWFRFTSGKLCLCILSSFTCLTKARFIINVIRDNFIGLSWGTEAEGKRFPLIKYMFYETWKYIHIMGIFFYVQYLNQLLYLAWVEWCLLGKFLLGLGRLMY